MNWTIEKTSDICQTIRIPYEAKDGWEQWGLLAADGHIDNEHSDLKLKRRHLEQASQRGAFICEFGDLLDLMQGKSDRRADKSALRDELRRSDYLNGVIEFAADFYEPYKDNLALISKGNHETAMTKYYEFDPLSALVWYLQKGNAPTILGGYRGWLRFMFERIDGTGGRMSKRAYYNHGGGGGGPVTKGVIKTNRRAVFLPDADFVFSGHIHESFLLEMPRIRLLDSGREVNEIQYHVQIPTYKEEMVNIGEGFHVEREAPPKPLGAWWIRFYYSVNSRRIETQFIRTEQ